MTGFPVGAVEAVSAASSMLHDQIRPVQTGQVSFGQFLQGGLERVNAKVAEAEKMASAFVLDDSIPVHQVTYALEEAKLSLELMLQVRGRLVEGYQQLMNMQL